MVGGGDSPHSLAAAVRVAQAIFSGRCRVVFTKRLCPTIHEIKNWLRQGEACVEGDSKEAKTSKTDAHLEMLKAMRDSRR